MLNVVAPASRWPNQEQIYLTIFVNKPTVTFNFLTGYFFFFKTHFERVRKAFETSEKRIIFFDVFN
jgi:hypothetical protein